MPNDGPEAVASLLNGREYGKEVTPEIRSIAKQVGVVIVHGGSDDLMEFDGVFSDEVGCFNGGTSLIDSDGVLPDRESIDTDDELDRLFIRRKKAVEIKALWCAEPGYSWTYKTSIPHKTFEIVEDGEPYCSGIVFRLEDCRGQ